jgi:hypothetical protein
VTKVGRNDPCPCGSGKKYKHCCLRKETAAKSEVISADRAWSEVADKLLAFSREDRFMQDLRAGFDLFWNSRHGLEQADSLDPMQVMTFLDWYVHDYSTSADGRRIVEIFLTERGSTLSDQERELLQTAQESWFSAYRVTDVEKWNMVKLLDIFQGLEYERLVTANGINRFLSITTLVPPEAEDDLQTYIQEMFVKYREDHYKASWKEFLRERSYLFNHFMLKVRGELPTPRVFVPQPEEAQARPVVLTPTAVEPEERKRVLVPGKGDDELPSRVLIPGRDR